MTLACCSTKSLLLRLLFRTHRGSFGPAEEWPELLEPIQTLVREQGFHEPVNCIFAVPSCAYTGSVHLAKPQGGTIWFVGNIKEGVFSDSVAEDYNIKSTELAEVY